MKPNSFMSSFPLVTVLMAYAFSSPSSASIDVGAKQALLEMVKAMGSLNYQGTVVYSHKGRAEPMKIFHTVRDGVEQERVVALNSPMREVIRDVDKITCYYPDSKKVVVENHPSRGSFLFRLPDELDSLALTYRFNLGGREHIALRPAQIIEILPKDDYRYARKIWMDAATKLPLKFELVGDDGSVIEQATFTSLNVDDAIPIKSLQAEALNEQFTWHVHNNETLPVSEFRFMFTELPSGFKQVRYSRRKMRNSDFPVEHILFSDGFSSVSVYVEQLENDMKSIFHTRGAIHAYTRKLDNYRITVMGEVPLKTVQTIGDGMQYQGQP